MNTNEGPQIITHPLVRTQVCNGCKFLNKQAMMRGHKSCTDNYTCTHPDFEGETVLFGRQNGRTIHFNHEGDCCFISFTFNWLLGCGCGGFWVVLVMCYIL
jgi:hypothetical protein